MCQTCFLDQAEFNCENCSYSLQGRTCLQSLPAIFAQLTWLLEAMPRGTECQEGSTRSPTRKSMPQSQDSALEVGDKGSFLEGIWV